MYRVMITIPCKNARHARSIKRIMDYALAGLYYNKEVLERLSSDIIAPPPVQSSVRKFERRLTLIKTTREEHP